MAYLLGWKDILRPIRDGYRHLFPTPDTGPTPEERRKQREQDRLKGFTYFDTFDQLDSWTDVDSDPLQRSNTPLLKRQSIDARDNLGKADLLLIHDYSGNYHDYEGIQGIGLKEELYACEYLQHVDSFIYFSHKLVCVPPPTWTNLLHRNGILVLGTILVEPQTEGSERLLQHEPNLNGAVFPVAKKLADIAMHYGFDGWLVNIEKPFPKNDWDPSVLEMFLIKLRSLMGGGRRVIWYDALTASNQVSYQNALTKSNAWFAMASRSMLTNYCWTDANAESSRQNALDGKMQLRDLFFGIDVWAQNTSSFTHPRVTYPEYGGGGTNTGVAVAKLAELRLSAGVFAPAWSFEHFPGHGRAVEQAIWEGTAVGSDVQCSCGDCITRHQANPELPILATARDWAAGSEEFFYTDFSRAFRKQRDASLYAQLSAQSILPRPISPKSRSQELGLSYKFENGVNCTILVIEAHKIQADSDPTDSITTLYLPLYKLHALANGSLQLGISCRNTSQLKGATVSVSLTFNDGRQEFIPTFPSSRTSTLQVTIGYPDVPFSTRLIDLGVRIQYPTPATAEALGTPRFMEILEIGIAPLTSAALLNGYHIDDIRVEQRGDGDTKTDRLCWGYRYRSTRVSKNRISGMPYSDLTGPFAYFLVTVNEQEMGRVYGLECILNWESMEVGRNGGGDVEVEIVGVGFCGRMGAVGKGRVVI